MRVASGFGRITIAALALAGTVLVARTAHAQTRPNAASGSGIAISQFDNPLGSSLGEGFGARVALSADGNTALVFGSETPKGCLEHVYVYDRVDGEWMASPAHVFTSPIPEPNPYAFCLNYGLIMTLSADGSTAVIAASHYFPELTTNLAAVYVYTRVDHVWSAAPVATFHNPDKRDGYCFGCAVALSADGKTILIGETNAPTDGVQQVGKVFLYREANGVWPTTPSAVFMDPYPTKFDSFGILLSLSENGNMALIAANNLIKHEGKTYLYNAQDSSWAQSPKPSVSFPYGGWVYLSPGAATVAVATDSYLTAPPHTVELRSYHEMNGQWPTTPRTIIFHDPSSANGDDLFGEGSVAFSGNGKVLLIHGLQALGRTTGPGCCQVVYVYTRRQGEWSISPATTLEQPNASSSPYNVYFGSGLALSGGGSIALIGDYQAPQPSPPPPNQVPTYGGPGVAFAFSTTNDWQSPPPPPPPPPPPKSTGSGGGAFGGLALLGLLLLAFVRARKDVSNPPIGR